MSTARAMFEFNRCRSIRCNRTQRGHDGPLNFAVLRSWAAASDSQINVLQRVSTGSGHMKNLRPACAHRPRGQDRDPPFRPERLSAPPWFGPFLAVFNRTHGCWCPRHKGALVVPCSIASHRALTLASFAATAAPLEPGSADKSLAGAADGSTAGFAGLASSTLPELTLMAFGLLVGRKKCASESCLAPTDADADRFFTFGAGASAGCGVDARAG